MVLDAAPSKPPIAFKDRSVSKEPSTSASSISLDQWREWLKKRDQLSKNPIDAIDDESVVQKDCPLKPIKDVIFTRETKKGEIETVNLTADYEKYFNYLYSTKAAEFESERTQFFEDYMKRMLAGEDYSGPLRLVILNKTIEPTAFVCPDGTIFFSQALINMLGTLDEVLAVMAHELGHLINKTSETEFKLPSKAHGVAWVHEFAATDLITSRLLEKVGVNSQALADAFLKFQAKFGNSRDLAHQAHLSRSVNIKLQSKFVPSTTSAVEKQTLDDKFIKSERKTNLELAKEIVESKDVGLIVTFLERLHPEDRLQWVSKYLKRGGSFDQSSTTNKAFIEFIQTKFPSENNTDLFQFFGFLLDASLLIDLDKSTVSESLDILTNMSKLVESGKANEWWQELFGTPFNPEEHSFAGEFKQNLVYFLRNQFFQRKKDKKDTTLDDGSFLNLVKRLYQFQDVLTSKLKDKESENIGIAESCNYLLLEYLDCKYLQAPKIDFISLKQLLLELKAMNFEAWIDEDEMEAFKQHPELDQVIQLMEDTLGIIIRRKNTEIEDKFSSMEAFLQHMDLQLATISDPNDFYQIFQNGIFEAVYPNSRVQNKDNSVEVQWIIQQGKKALDWVKQINLDQYYPHPFQQEYFRMTLYHCITGQCFLQEFPEDDFIQVVEEMMQSCRLNIDELSFDEVFLLTKALGVPHILGRGGESEVINTDNLYQNRFFKALQEKKPQMNINSPEELSQEIKKRIQLLQYDVYPFRTDVISQWAFNDVSGELVKILPSLSSRDIPKLLDLFQYFPHENQTLDLKKKMMKHYIMPASEASLEEKVDFLLEHHADLGYEGLVTVCQQIEKYEDFIALSSKIDTLLKGFISGERPSSHLAAVDTALSFMGKGFDILQTIDSSRNESATDAAESWLSILQRSGVKYEPPAKIIMEKLGKSEFSLKEVFSVLQNLDPLTKSGIVSRILTDVHNPLTQNEKTRDQLMELIYKVFHIKNSFVRMALEGAVHKGRADYVGLQLSQLIGPILFRNLSTNKIDYQSLKKNVTSKAKEQKKQIPEFMPHLEDLFQKTSEELFELGFTEKHFGRAHDPNSILSQTALEQQQIDYKTIDQSLRNKFGLDPIIKYEENKDLESKPNNINDNEAIINAMERGGALFVRCLQIASQLFSFEPATAKRLANTLDQAEKMDSFRFWMALKTYGEKYSHFGEWLTKNLVKVENIIGGGSLYTTYAVIVKHEGQEIPAVLKLLKPNSEAELNDARQVALSAVENVLAKGSKADQDTARMAKRIVDISYQWCKDDINDKNYPEDDRQFAETIKQFNSQNDGIRIEQSQNFFTDTFATCESRFNGRTLNSFIQDPAIATDEKKKVFTGYEQFFNFQSQFGDEESLSHSDPHVGNYQVISSGDEVILGMMDRKLYLHDNPKDKEVLLSLRNGNYPLFLDLFVSLMCEVNQKTEKKALLSRKIKLQLLQRRMRTIFDRKESFVGDFNIVLSVMENSEVNVPYQWQLRIRNEFMKKTTEARLEY